MLLLIKSDNFLKQNFIRILLNEILTEMEWEQKVTHEFES